MSYWFEQPHTLVLACSRIDLRNPRKRDRLRAVSETPSAERALDGVTGLCQVRVALGNCLVVVPRFDGVN